MAIFKVTAKPDFTELKSAISGLESTPIKIDIDTTPVIAKIKATSQNLTKMTQTFDGSGQMTGVVQQYNGKLGETVQVTRRLNKETGDLEVTQEKVTQNYEKVAKAAERAAQIQAKAQEAAQKAQDAEANRAAAEAQKIQNVLGSMGTNIGTFSGNAAEAKEWIASLDGMSGATVKATGNVRNAAGVFQTYSAAVDGAKGTTDNFTFAINESTGEVYKLANGAVDAAKKNSLLGDSIGRVLLKMAAWQIFGDMISKVIGSFREALNTLKDVDTEMVNVQKVTDYSSAQMQALEENAYALASAYGRTADEITAMYTTFARAGYLDDQLDSMTELGTLLANIGDISQDTASKFLLAVDAAWKLNGSESELMTVMDGLNEITNKNAVDMEALTSGITVAGSVFAEAGESVQTFSALVGAGVAATQRSGSEISRGLRTIVMNIRQIKGETEDGELVDGESIAKASNALREYAGISTMANGQLRESSAVLSDLAGKWDTLDTVAQSAIAEALAGKRQANILTALMGNWETVEKMMQDYADGAGSALRENEIYLDSWEAKSKQLTASWTEFVSHLLDSETVKTVLDGLIALVKLLDSDVGRFTLTVGALTTAVIALGVAKEKLDKTDTIKTLKATMTAVKELTASVWKYVAAKKAADAAGKSFSGNILSGVSDGSKSILTKLGSVAKVAGILGAFYGAFKWADKERQRPAKELEEATNDVAEAQQALLGTDAEYDALISKTEELTDTEKERLKVLQEIRKEQQAALEEAQHERWEKWNNVYGSGAKVVIGGAEGVGGGLGTGAVQTEGLDVTVLRNYTAEIEELRGQLADGTISEQEFLDALEESNAAREDSVETIRAAIAAGYEVTNEQRQLVAAYDKVQEILGVTQKATEDYVNKLISEATQAGYTGKALYDLVAAQITASDTKLDFTQQISALRTLAATIGYTTEAYGNLLNAGRIYQQAMVMVANKKFKTLEEAQAYLTNKAWDKLTGTAPSGGWTNKTGTSGGTSSGSGAAKNATQEQIDALEKQRDAELAAIDEQIEALKKQNEETERGEKLEELKLAVLKKQDALLNARNERTVRMYNAETGQWEWIADPEKVKKAEEDLADAKKDLRDYERQVELDLAIEELEARKKAIEAAYQLQIDALEEYLDQLGNTVTEEKAWLDESAANWENWSARVQAAKLAAQAQADAAARAGGGGTVSGAQLAAGAIDSKTDRAYTEVKVGNLTGLTRNTNSTSGGWKPSTSASTAKGPSNWGTTKAGSIIGGVLGKKYDSGGVLHGLGGIKATADDEMVLPPDITAKMLQPSADARFRARVNELGGLYGETPVSRSVAGSSDNRSYSDHSGPTYNVKGITLTEQQAERLTVAEMCRMAHNVKPYGG